MTITRDTLRADLRVLFQNLLAQTVSDETLDLVIGRGLWRMSKDRPSERHFEITTTGKRFEISSLITDWVPEFSVVRQCMRPYPDDVSFDNIALLDHKDYRVVQLNGAYWLYFYNTVSSQGALVTYTTTWKLTGIDGAATTTVPDSLGSALLWVSAHFLATSMASKMAGTNDKQMPADFVNFRSKSDEYRRVGREYEASYLRELNLSHDRPPALGLVMDVDQSTQMGEPYMTHRPHGTR